MKLISDDSIRILGYAREREKESRDYYRECLEKATVPGTQEILKGLVADEERHYTIVSELLEEAKKSGTVKDLKTADTDDAKTRLEKAFPHKMTDDAGFSAESATVGAMLKKALGNEKESFDHYSKAAVDATEDEIIGIYTYLAKEENKHYILIDNLISFLDDPGKWLYEEENLIFRL